MVKLILVQGSPQSGASLVASLLVEHYHRQRLSYRLYDFDRLGDVRRRYGGWGNVDTEITRYDPLAERYSQFEKIASVAIDSGKDTIVNVGSLSSSIVKTELDNLEKIGMFAEITPHRFYVTTASPRSLADCDEFLDLLVDFQNCTLVHNLVEGYILPVETTIINGERIDLISLGRIEFNESDIALLRRNSQPISQTLFSNVGKLRWATFSSLFYEELIGVLR